MKHTKINDKNIINNIKIPLLSVTRHNFIIQ